MCEKTKLQIMLPLWVAQPVKNILEIHADWAASYNDVLAEYGYGTPSCIAAALAKSVSPKSRILDFGCGTGLSGLALRKVGFTKLDGLDISPSMLSKAQSSRIYQKLWQGQPGNMAGVVQGNMM